MMQSLTGIFFRYEVILADGYYDVSTSKPIGWYYLSLVFHGPNVGITVYHDGVEIGEELNKITWSSPYVSGILKLTHSELLNFGLSSSFAWKSKCVEGFAAILATIDQQVQHSKISSASEQV